MATATRLLLLVLLVITACQTDQGAKITSLPDASYMRAPEQPFAASDYVFKLSQMEHFYDAPGEFGYMLEGHKYGFDSLSLILTETHPGGGPPLHTHRTEEAHVVFTGTATYIIGDSIFTVSGPYVAKVPAGVPHTFINAGDEVFNLIAIFPDKHLTFGHVGPNPLVEK